MRRLTHLIVLAAFIFSCGAQWAVFQCIAWVNMIHEYSQVVPLAQAVQMTFSGQYPCQICKAIAEKKNSDEQKSLAFDKLKKDFVLPAPMPIAEPLTSEVEYLEPSTLFGSRSDTPPAPPPRIG